MSIFESSWSLSSHGIFKPSNKSELILIVPDTRVLSDPRSLQGFHARKTLQHCSTTSTLIITTLGAVWRHTYESKRGKQKAVNASPDHIAKRRGFPVTTSIHKNEHTLHYSGLSKIARSSICTDLHLTFPPNDRTQMDMTLWIGTFRSTLIQKEFFQNDDADRYAKAGLTPLGILSRPIWFWLQSVADSSTFSILICPTPTTE